MVTEKTVESQEVTANKLFLPNIATSDPGVAGQVYSNAGVLTVSAG